MELNMTINLSEEEVSDIIVKHLSHIGYEVKSKPNFILERKYHGFQDEHGTMELTNIKVDVVDKK